MGQGTNGAFFRRGKYHFARGEVAWQTATIKAALFRSDAETSHLQSITNVTDVGSGNDRCRITTGSAHGWTDTYATYSDDTYVHVYNVNGATEANGTWKVVNASGSTLDLVGSGAPSSWSASPDAYVLNLTIPDVIGDFQANVNHANQTISAGKTTDGGELDGDDITFTNAGSGGGQDCEALIIYVDASYVLGIITEGTGLTQKVTTNGGNVNVTWAAYILGL